jgi:hypothetical protein
MTKLAFQAFPTAWGFGKNTLGGKYGKIIKVNRLDDPTLDTPTIDAFESAGAGSLRWALTRTYRRIIIETVSGNYTLSSRISIQTSQGNFTYLGMLSSGMGTCISQKGLGRVKAGNYIFRYLKVRTGDVTTTDAVEALPDLAGPIAEDFIYDSCSISWGTDEVFSSYSAKDATIQNCIISEGLNNHYGMLLGGDNVSFFRNLIPHAIRRTPQVTNIGLNNLIVDVRECLFYNNARPMTVTTATKVNLVNNYYRRGDNTLLGSLASERSINAIAWIFTFTTGNKPEMYADGNILEGVSTVNSDNWVGVRGESTTADALDMNDIKRETPHTVPVGTYPTALSATQARDFVLENAGKNVIRDSNDARLIQEATNNTWSKGTLGIVSSVAEAGGLPTLSSTPVRLTGSEPHLIPSNIITEFGLDPSSYDYMVDGDPSEAPWKYIFFEDGLPVNYETLPIDYDWENTIHHTIHEVMGMKVTGEYVLLVDEEPDPEPEVPIPPVEGKRFFAKKKQNP